MKTKSFVDCDRSRLESLNKYQLPYRFKQIGIIILILSFITLFANKFILDELMIRAIAKYGMLIGLLVISISKEKIEDELITKLRMQSYTFAFIVGVLYSLVLPFIDYLVDVIRKSDEAAINGLGDFVILWILLSVQVLYFEFLKRMHK